MFFFVILGKIEEQVLILQNFEVFEKFIALIFANCLATIQQNL